MAKKNKKEPKDSRGGTLVFSLLKFLGFVLIVVLLILIYKPELAPNSLLQAQLFSLKAQLSDANIRAQEQILGSFNSATKDNPVIPGKIQIGSQTIYVEDLVVDLVKELEKVPATQLTRLRADICAPLLLEATASASQASTLE